MAGRFPKPYVNEVKQDDGIAVYVPFDRTDIGATSQGMPKVASSGPKAIEHVSNRSTGNRS